MSGEDKFAKFRNRYRRVYGFQRVPPDNRTFIDPLTNLTSSVDLTKFVRDRDFFLIDQIFAVSSLSAATAEYEEDLIGLTYEDSKTINFTSSFIGTPVVVLDVWPNGEDTDFIVPYILDVSATSLTIGVSAKTTGTIRYKAIYLTPGNAYPATVTRSPLYPSTTTIAVAGQETLTNQIDYLVSYPDYSAQSGGVNPELGITTQDILNYEADIYIEKDSIGSASTAINLSSAFTGKLNWIALKP